MRLVEWLRSAASTAPAQCYASLGTLPRKGAFLLTGCPPRALPFNLAVFIDTLFSVPIIHLHDFFDNSDIIKGIQLQVDVIHR